MDQPILLNLVVKILKNISTRNIGKTTYRQVTMDVGNGRHTMLKAQKGSDLYDSYDEKSKLKPGTMAVLKNVESSKLSGKTLLTTSNKAATAANKLARELEAKQTKKGGGGGHRGGLGGQTRRATDNVAFMPLKSAAGETFDVLLDNED